MALATFAPAYPLSAKTRSMKETRGSGIRRSIGDGGLRIWREGGVGRRAAQEIERHLERLLVLLVRRHIGLRARFFGALRLEVTAQRCLALGVDGCRADWVVVFLRPNGDEVRVRTIQRFADVLSAVEAPAVVAIDIPIGLPDRVGPEGRGPVSLPVSPCYLFLEKS